jgi:hypothetical protein
VLQWRTPIPFYGFWWEVGHEYHLWELEMKTRAPRRGYVMKGQEAVGLNMKLNLSHMELLLCSGASLSDVVKSLSKKYLLREYLLCSILAELVVQDITTFPAHIKAV